MKSKRPDDLYGITPLEYRYRSRKPWATLWTLFAERRRDLILATVFFVIKHSPVWIMPVLFSRIIGIVRAPESHTPGDLWLAVGIMLALVLQNIPTHITYVRFLSRSGRHVECGLRQALVRRLQHLSITFHVNSESGRLHTKVLRDVEAVQTLAHQLIETGLSGVVGIGFAVAVTLTRDPRATLLYAVMVPVAVGLQRVFRRHLRQRNQDFRDAVEGMSARVAEMIDMIPVTRAHGLEDQEIARMSGELESVRETGVRMDVTNSLFHSLSWVTMQVPQILFLGVAGYACYRTGRPPVEDVILYWGFFQTILGSVNMLLNVYPTLARGFESIRSIGEVLECPDIEANEGKRAVARVNGAFRFEQVGYRYADNAPWAVADFTLDVAAGEHIALVGASGSGKTTLMNMVIGFRRPTAGRILLDGTDMQALDLRTFRRYIAVIPQDTILFGGTIRDNITYGLDRPDERRLMEILEAANVMEFVRTFPQGLDTPVGEHGAKLSGGQRQRISIARAFVREPRIVLMDEATSALDPATETLVQEALERLMVGRTTFSVAHRLKTIRRADRIAVMRQGALVELDGYDALMARNGEFRRLHDLAEPEPVGTP